MQQSTLRNGITTEGEPFIAFFGKTHFLSNHYLLKTPFVFDDIEYQCVEKFYYHAMAKMFGVEHLAAVIVTCTTGAEAKEVGDEIKAALDRKLGKGTWSHMWQSISTIVMETGNLAKYRINPDLATELKATGDTPLVEANPRDAFWGIKKGINDPTIGNTSEWGMNVLGRILVAIRKRLRFEEAGDVREQKKVVFSAHMSKNAKPLQQQGKSLQEELEAELELAIFWLEAQSGPVWPILLLGFMQRNEGTLEGLLTVRDQSAEVVDWARSLLSVKQGGCMAMPVYIPQQPSQQPVTSRSGQPGPLHSFHNLRDPLQLQMLEPPPPPPDQMQIDFRRWTFRQNAEGGFKGWIEEVKENFPTWNAHMQQRNAERDGEEGRMDDDGPPPSSEEVKAKIEMRLSDITQQKFDAIVNVTNTTMQEGGNLHVELHSLAGTEMMRECEMMRGNKAPGAAIISQSFKLPYCKFVIHVAGPEKMENTTEEMLWMQLALCYINALVVTKLAGQRNIAFPCIGTGTRGLEPKKAAQVAYATIKKWLETRTNFEAVDKVVICIRKKADEEAYGQVRWIMEDDQRAQTKIAWTTDIIENAFHCREENELREADAESEDENDPTGIRVNPAEVQSSSRSAAEIALLQKISYAKAASTKGDFPTYMICQAQKKRAIGVVTTPDFWPDNPHYMGFKAEEAEMSPPTSKFQVGQHWLVKKFDWNEGYKRLDKREQGGSNFKRTNTGENKAGKPILNEESMNCQAFADQYEKTFDPPSKQAIAVVAKCKGGAKRGMVLMAYAAELTVPARIESWSTSGFKITEKKPGDKILLTVNQVPKGTWVGPRYVFPPRAGWHSVKDVKAKKATYVAVCSSEHKDDNSRQLSTNEKALRNEQLFIVNTQMKIEAEEEEECKFSFKTDVIRIPEEENSYTLMVAGTMANEGQDHDFLVGIMSRWDRGIGLVIREDLHRPSIAAGRVRDRNWHSRGGRWKLEIIATLTPHRDSNLRFADLVNSKKTAYAVIPSQTFKLRRMLNDMRSSIVARVAAEDSPRGRILRKMMGLETQLRYTCDIDHARDLAPYLNQRQLEAANRFLCHHTIGDVIPIQAPFGTGKTRSLRWMVAYLVAKYPDAVVAVMCSMNIPLIDLVRDTLGILQEEDSMVPTTVLLSKRAMDEFITDIREAQLERYLHTLEYDERGQIRGVANENVMKKVEEVQPRLIFVTPDKATMMPEVLSRATHLVFDEVGRLYQVVGTHLVASAPMLQKVILAADKEQPTTQMGNAPNSFKKESTGYASMLTLVMEPRWGFPIVEYDRSYRGHPELTRDLSEAIYNGRVVPALQEEERQLFINSGINMAAVGYPAILLDNQVPESTLAYSNSCYNEAETDVALRIYARLINLKNEGVIPGDTTIGIVCYYKAAVDHTKMIAAERGLGLSDSDINTVDAFIGGERDFIILLTSKTTEGSLFLADPQRATAAWSRQKHGIIVIANFDAYASRGRTARIVGCITRHTPILGAATLNSNRSQLDGMEAILTNLCQRTRNLGLLWHEDSAPLARGYDRSFNRKWVEEERAETNFAHGITTHAQPTNRLTFNRPQQRRHH